MAKVVSDEILKLKFVINGDEAQKKILDLELANKGLGASLKDLEKTRASLGRARKKDTDEYKANEAAIKKLTSQIADNKAQIDKEIQSMNILSLTMEQLSKRATELRFRLSHMNPNSPEYAVAQQEIARLTGRMSELRTGATQSGFSIGDLADKVNRYSGMVAAAAATIAGVAISIKETIDLNNKLADAQTAVSKTTGLTNEEVKELSKSYSDFNTRTSKMDLLKISEVGGRLGVPKAEIKDFTQEVDKMYVALGDGFSGGVEQVATQLGKIKGLFKETKELDAATAFNQIGSALNELGANGAASEANIADFALRLGSLPETLKPSIAETLALGAAFEESGVDAERAGTAYASFIKTAAKETGKFAEVMGISKKEVDDLINKDPMQFFLKFSEGAKGMETTELAKMLEYLKLNDQYVASIVGAASENTERFRDSIDLSNKSLIEATSLQIEFDKVNNNAAGTYEKVRKKFLAMFTSETVAKTLNWLIQTIAELLGVSDNMSASMSVFRATLIHTIKVVAIITATALSYRTALILTDLWTKRNTISTSLWSLVLKLAGVETNRLRAATILGAAAKALFTGNLTRARAAMILFNRTVAVNPLGLLLGAITLVVGAFIYFKNEADKAKIAQKELAEEQNRASTIMNQVAEQGKIAQDKFRDSTKMLIDVLKSEVSTQEMRKRAYESLIKVHPQFIGTVDKEYRATANLAKVYLDLAYSIDLSAKAKARAAAREDIYRKIEEDRIKYIQGASARENEQKERDAFRARYKGKDSKESINYMVGGFVGFEENNKGAALISSINKNTALINQLNAADSKRVNEIQIALKSAKGQKRKNLEVELNSYLAIGGEIGGTETQSAYNIPTTGSDKGTSKSTKSTSSKKSDAETKAEEEAKALQKRIDDYLEQSRSAYKDMGDVYDEFEAAKIDAMEEGKAKEEAKLELELSLIRKSNDAKIHSQMQYADLDDAIAKTSGDKQQELLNLKKAWLQQDEQYNAIEIKQIEIHEIKKKTLDEKFIAQDIARQEQEFNRQVAENKINSDLEIANRKTVADQKAFLQDKISSEELAKIKTWEEGKAGIEKYYQEQSLDLQQKYLQNLVDQLEELPTASLTQEQVQVLEAMRIKLAEIAKIKASLKNGDDKSSKFQGTKLSQFGGTTDLLGLSSDQWQAMFANIDTTLDKTEQLEQKIQKIGAAIEVTKNLFSTYFEFVAANEAASLAKVEYSSEKRKEALENQLDQGIINQEEYKKLTLEIDANLEKKKAEAEYKLAKRQKAMAIASAISNTALSVVKTLATTPWPLNLVMAGIVAGMGALQVATIAKQPLPDVPGAEDGLYPVMRSQDRKLFNAKRKPMQSGMYDEPTVLVGEGGKGRAELVVDDRTLKRLKPTTVNTMMAEIAQIRGFENGKYPETNSSSSNDDLMIMMIAALNKNTEILEKIDRNGVQGVFEKGQRVGKIFDESITEYRNRINNNKHG